MKPRESGFSLVEVILAIGVFALTIVAVIGLLGPIAQQVRDLQDTKVANSLPAPIREELNRLGFQYFVTVGSGSTSLYEPAFPSSLGGGANGPQGEAGNSLVLYGTEDGGRVVVQGGAIYQGEAEVSPNADSGSMALADDQRYFMVQIFPATGNLSYKDGDAHVAFRVAISWPYKLTGMGADDYVSFEDRRTFEYYTAIVVGEPF